MELPTITTSTGYASSAPINLFAQQALQEREQFTALNKAKDDALDRVGQDFARRFHANALTQPKQESPAMSPDRIVKVFIADTNANIPAEKRILFSGPEKFCDLTDQELFFEVPILELLTAHNEYRKTVPNKSASEKFGRDVFLDPIRVKDLRMVVVTVAQF